MKKISLVHFKPNQKGKVAEIAGGATLHHRLMSLGVYPGREISKVSHIGLKGPVVIKVGRGILALGHSIAAKVMMEHP